MEGTKNKLYDIFDETFILLVTRKWMLLFVNESIIGVNLAILACEADCLRYINKHLVTHTYGCWQFCPALKSTFKTYIWFSEKKLMVIFSSKNSTEATASWCRPHCIEQAPGTHSFWEESSHSNILVSPSCARFTSAVDQWSGTSLCMVHPVERLLLVGE